MELWTSAKSDVTNIFDFIALRIVKKISQETGNRRWKHKKIQKEETQENTVRGNIRKHSRRKHKETQGNTVGGNTRKHSRRKHKETQ